MQETAALRYSHALFESGKDLGKIDEFLTQMKDVALTFKAHDELFGFFNHPNVKNEEKQNVLNEIFKNMDKEVLNLIMLLIGHGRIHEIGIVYEDLRDTVYAHRGIKIANAITAVPMETEEIELLREKLSLKYESKFEIENAVDSEVLGGVYLKIGDEVIDGSVRGQLERMRKELFNNTLEG
jgi:F-type H+-transporting ATPase subunit delta